MTVAALLAARAGDPAPGLLAGDREWSWSQVVDDSAARAALLAGLRRSGPFHVAVLLDNVAEYVWWIGAAALAGAAVVGINPTRSRVEIARDLAHTDCQLLVTDTAGLAFVEGFPPERTLVVDQPAYRSLLGPYAGVGLPDVQPAPEDLLLLLFTSGTTGAPKAVRCTQGRLASIADNVVPQYGFVPDDVCYCPMPLFHGNALMALWSGALRVGAAVALPSTGKFSAGGFLHDVRRYRATYFTYVGKALTYILATPEAPDDADNSLVRAFGNEASDTDIARFERRFGCQVVEGYGSSEGGAVVRRVPDMPAGSLGVGQPGVIIADPATGYECPRATFDAGGRLLNAAEAIGEIVNTEGGSRFEGYYANPEADAERMRGGWYWSGDLGYRDADGFVYFAGRNADWLRVDGENFAAAPVERVLARFTGVRMAAVYAVPDPLAGDQVMAALVLDEGSSFDGSCFEAFLAEQGDLGSKWRPRLVRLCGDLPLTASGKVVKASLRVAGWSVADEVWWRPDARAGTYERLDEAGRDSLRADFAAHGREALLPEG